MHAMKVHTLTRTQVVHAELEECWAFFSNPGNLSRITPPSVDFRVLSDVPEKIYAGLMIHYRVRPLFGIPMRWLTEITQVRELEYFADEQRVGPYAIWHHEHFFRKLEDSRVEMRDMVHYALLFGFAGEIVHEMVVKRELERIFLYREKTVEALFGGRTK